MPCGGARLGGRRRAGTRTGLGLSADGENGTRGGRGAGGPPPLLRLSPHGGSWSSPARIPTLPGAAGKAPAGPRRTREPQEAPSPPAEQRSERGRAPPEPPAHPPPRRAPGTEPAGKAGTRSSVTPPSSAWDTGWGGDGSTGRTAARSAAPLPARCGAASQPTGCQRGRGSAQRPRSPAPERTAVTAERPLGAGFARSAGRARGLALSR